MNIKFIKEVGDSLLIIQRSFISSLYLIFFFLFLYLYPDFGKTVEVLSANFSLIFIIIIPVIISHGCYEIIMPIHRYVSKKPAIKGFNNVVVNKFDTSNIDYDF